MAQACNNGVPEEGDDVPFGPPVEEYLYRCSACGEEWLVEDVIVDAVVEMAKFRGEYDGRLPSLGCPGCNGDTLEYVDD
jgi:DNA-directed RNA polymerase subunit RPC12/RpoP